MSKLTELTSNRLEYRRFTEHDFNDLLEMLGDPEVCKYMPGPSSYSKEDVAKWLDFFIKEFSLENRNLIYAVSLKGRDKVIGYCGCSYVREFERNEIKYFLNKAYFRRGYGLEMAYRMKHLAKDLGFRFLVGLVDVNNVGSYKILEKIGYKYKEDIELWGSYLRYYEINF